MKNELIFSVSGMIAAYPMKSDKDDMMVICFNLLRFSYDNGLLNVCPFDENDELLMDTIIYEDDLTALGKRIFNDLMYDWLNYTDKTDGKIDRKNNVKMLEKYFNKLNGNM
ncbi:hypothetical protein DYQ05_10470 [Treponema pedis]|nr:hypothetical protein IFE08_08915 [Treponema pedis]QSI05306.1 hypothetical protein DYQ05_10470 [Treponema pedis]